MTLHPKVQKLKELMKKTLSDKQEYPLFTGRRTKESPDIIIKKGICTLTPFEYKQSIKDALRYFNKDKLLTTSGYKGELIRSIIRETRNPDRASIFASTVDKNVCTWAKNNPEHISLVLSYAGVPEKDILNYLEITFGSCKYIELTDKFNKIIDINLMKRCLKPEEIKKVTKCKEC